MRASSVVCYKNNSEKLTVTTERSFLKFLLALSWFQKILKAHWRNLQKVEKSFFFCFKKPFSNLRVFLIAFKFFVGFWSDPFIAVRAKNFTNCKKKLLDYHHMKCFLTENHANLYFSYQIHQKKQHKTQQIAFDKRTTKIKKRKTSNENETKG